MRHTIMTRVAIFGDHFVRSEVLEQKLREHVQPLLGELECTSHVMGYPYTPSANKAQLREFIGNPEEVAAAISDVEIVVDHMAPITAPVLKSASKVKIIGCCRTEPVNIDIEAATQAGIPVVYAPGRNARAVAEFTVGLIIAECRNICRGHAALAEGVWRADLYLYDQAPSELAGQTIGLIGFGNIGRMLPAYLKPFELRVLAYDPYVPDEVFAEKGAERVTDLAELLAESDIISLHARVTPETIKFIGEEQFRQMKPGAYFFNTARGPMVDYDALYRALVDGYLRGAGLETFAIEPPPPDWPILKLPNVTLTPHIAGCSVDSVHLVGTMIARDIANFYAGRPLNHCANPEVMQRA
jgi:D-3-phosphoglycerate dehydrogenase / 2-oxoglutarate reductase